MKEEDNRSLISLQVQLLLNQTSIFQRMGTNASLLVFSWKFKMLIRTETILKKTTKTYTLALIDIKTHYNKDKVTMKQRQKSQTTHQHTIT